MQIESFYDPRSSTLTYVVFDARTKDAVVIDPVLDYNPVGSKLWTESADVVADYVRDNELRLHFILETHAHADHLSGSRYLQSHFPDARIAIGERIREIQRIFKGVFDLPESFATDGSQFDRLIHADECLDAGSIRVEAIPTPGHTPACLTYRVGDAIFTGDTLFMPDGGTGRCDFPGGSAEAMYASIQRLYALPDATRVFVGHDYQPNGRPLAFETTVGEQKRSNIQLRAETTAEHYIELRTTRDKKLNAPALLFQSIQVNVDAGTLPAEHGNGRRYFRIPINVFKPEPTDLSVEPI